MKMRKTIAMLAALTMALGMVSCGDGDSGNSSAAASSQPYQGTSTISIDDINLTEATAKNFKVKVADGWKLMSASEIGSMMDNSDFLVKGDKWDAAAPYIQISSTTGSIYDWKEQLKKDPYVKYDGDYGFNIEGQSSYGVWSIADKIAGTWICGKIVTVTPQNGADLKDKEVQAMMATINWVTVELTTAAVTETTAESTAVTAEAAATTVTTTSASAATTTATAAETTTTAVTTTSMLEGGLPTHNLPVPGVHDFELPDDCPYNFDMISGYAKNYYANQKGRIVQYAEAEKLEGDILTIHLYDIEELRPLDYQYYYVDYHNLKGKDADGNPVDLTSDEKTAGFPTNALDKIDFGVADGAALYLGALNADSDFNKGAIQMILAMQTPEFKEKYSFMLNIPEDHYVTDGDTARPYANLWLLIPRPDVQNNGIYVMDYVENNRHGMIFHSEDGTPIILAVNENHACEVTFFSNGKQLTFRPYIQYPDEPVCSGAFIKILN